MAFPDRVLDKANEGRTYRSGALTIPPRQAKALSRLDDRSYCSSQAATDAAAVNTLLRAARVAMPERVTGALELESGFNDPISVFLTILLSQGLNASKGITASHAILMFVQEMVGEAIAGVAGGYALLWLLGRLRLETAVYP